MLIAFNGSPGVRYSEPPESQGFGVSHPWGFPNLTKGHAMRFFSRMPTFTILTTLLTAGTLQAQGDKEIAYDVLDRAYDPDTTLSAGAKRFIDRHVTPGAKRPPAPSVLRQPDQSARKKA